MIPKGNRIEISISKIKKIIAIRKNRIEKGIREVFLGSNPHSNGDLFSWSKNLFFDNNLERVSKMALITEAIKNARIKI